MKFQPQIITFYCDHSLQDHIFEEMVDGNVKSQLPGLKFIRVPCSGKIESHHILRAFEQGVDGVCVFACHSGCCHFLTGNIRLKKRVEYVKSLLEHIGLEADRLFLINIASVEGERFSEITKKLITTIGDLGPNPLKLKVRDN